MVLVPVFHPLRFLLISALRIYLLLLLLLLLLVLHVLAPGLVTAWLILYHCVGSCYVAAAPATSPLSKTAVVGLLEGSLLLVLCPLLGVGRLCLSLLRWSRLERLPMLRGGRWGSIHFHVLVLPHILFACICAYCGCCVCTSLAAGPPFPTDAIWNCSEFTAACMNSLWDLAAALSSRYFAVASFNPSSAR